LVEVLERLALELRWHTTQAVEDTCMSSTDPKKPEPNLWVRELTNGIKEGGRLLDATCCMVRHERGAANGGTE
jgi:hypothetical protein